MYYFFKAKQVYREGELLQAIAMNEPPREYAKKWWYGEGFTFLPYKFRFSVDEQASLLDNYWTGNIWDLYSERLISIFKNAKVKYELFPVDILSRSTGKLLSSDYKIFRLTEINNCLDEDRSVYKIFSVGNRQIKALAQPFFTNEFIRSGRLLTRIAGHERYVIIHDELKTILEDENISGCRFSEKRLDESGLFV
jgi:hypothetical protein